MFCMDILLVSYNDTQTNDKPACYFMFSNKDVIWYFAFFKGIVLYPCLQLLQFLEES
jgi:hypothetical protein